MAAALKDMRVSSSQPTDRWNAYQTGSQTRLALLSIGADLLISRLDPPSHTIRGRIVSSGSRNITIHFSKYRIVLFISIFIGNTWGPWPASRAICSSGHLPRTNSELRPISKTHRLRFVEEVREGDEVQ